MSEGDGSNLREVTNTDGRRVGGVRDHATHRAEAHERLRKRMETDLQNKENALSQQELELLDTNKNKLLDKMLSHQEETKDKLLKVLAVKAYWLHLPDQVRQQNPWDVNKWTVKFRASSERANKLIENDAYNFDEAQLAYEEKKMKEWQSLENEPLEAKQQRLGLWEMGLSELKEEFSRMEREFHNSREQSETEKSRFDSERLNHLRSVSLDQIEAVGAQSRDMGKQLKLENDYIMEVIRKDKLFRDEVIKGIEHMHESAHKAPLDFAEIKEFREKMRKIPFLERCCQLHSENVRLNEKNRKLDNENMKLREQLKQHTPASDGVPMERT